MSKIIAAIVAAIVTIIAALFGGNGGGGGSTTTTTSPTAYTPTTTAVSTTESPAVKEAITFENYVYGSDPTRQCLDLYIPKNAKGNVGLVLYIHGGFWMMGDKSIFSADAKETVGKGYCSATMSYRYASASTHLDDILDDVASAAQAIKTLAASKGVNIDKMIVVGHSAGAHLAMMYAYTRVSSSPITPVAVWDKSGPTNLADEMWKDGGSSIYTVFSCLTGYNITESNFTNNAAKYVLAQASPIAHINSGTVPTIISHGKNDKTVPYANGVQLYQALALNNVKVAAITYPNSDHGLESDPASDAQARSTLYQWANMYMGSPVK